MSRPIHVPLSDGMAEHLRFTDAMSELKRESFRQWVNHMAECVDAEMMGLPKPKPPTLPTFGDYHDDEDDDGEDTR